jgi:hypothetical protein
MESFDIEKLKKTIENYNTFLMNKNDAQLDEKIVTYFNKLSFSLKNSNNTEAIKLFLIEIFSLDFSFYKKYGDDLLEKLWNLYDTKSIVLEGCVSIDNIYNSNNSRFVNKANLFSHLLAQFLQFNSGLLVSLTESNIINAEKLASNKIEITTDKDCIIKFITDNQLSRNGIIDILILLIYSKIEFQEFYTTLSTFIVTVNTSTVLLFKIISLFSLCMINLENKFNFIDSLLFVTGSILRDHARSYLKAKNKYNECLTYHVCKKKHNKKDHQFSDPVVLSSIECDYIEQNFLSVLLGFLLSIVTGESSDSKLKWDSYLDVFYKYLELEEMDVEEHVDSNVVISHYVMLFLSDFLFFFISNFCEYDLNRNSKINII